MSKIFIPSLAPSEDVLIPYLSWRKFNQFRHLSALEAAAGWVKMRPLTPDNITTVVQARPGRKTFGVGKSERRLPLLFQILGILRRAEAFENAVSLSNAIAPAAEEFYRLAGDIAKEPKWDDVDGGRRYPLRSFLLCAAIRNLASLGSGVRIVVPEPRFAECKNLLFELHRLASIGGPSIEIGELKEAEDAPLWDYLPDLESRRYAENPGLFHSQVVAGFGIAAPTALYRHMLRMARSLGRNGHHRSSVGFSALSAIRLLPRWRRHRPKTLRVLAEIAYANSRPDFRALVCYEVALQLCHERTGPSLSEANSWLTKGFKALSVAEDNKQFIWEVRLRNCDAFYSHVSGDSENALRKLRATLNDISTRVDCDDVRHSWASAIVMTNMARILQRNGDALAEALAYWREVERCGNGPQREYALGEQVKAQVRLGRLQEAMTKAGEYCNRDNYMSVHLDWELAFRKVYCLTALRIGSPRHPTELDVDRITELEWWCNGKLVT